MNSNCRQFSRP